MLFHKTKLLFNLYCNFIICLFVLTVNKYLSSENPLFFELRARYLIACERIPEAMALIKSCMNHPDISKDLYFHQAFFTCLYMSPMEDQLFQEVPFVNFDILFNSAALSSLWKKGMTHFNLYYRRSTTLLFFK